MEAGPGLSRSHLNSAVELASNKAIFPAGVGLQRQAPVSPQLPLGPEAMRGLDQSNQQSGADGADRGNLAQQSRRAVLLALGQLLSR